jgi:hypothetical protein
MVDMILGANYFILDFSKTLLFNASAKIIGIKILFMYKKRVVKRMKIYSKPLHIYLILKTRSSQTQFILSFTFQIWFS